MARRPRLFAAGLLYHVIVRGNQRQKTFRTDQDYKAYLERLGRYREKFCVTVYAYCLMPNHVHLLLESSNQPLARFMQSLQQSYTQHFNRVHGKAGHLFQGRYKAIVCEKEEYLLSLVRYIHLNPVRANLVRRPEQYTNSSHTVYLSGKATEVLDPCKILELVGGKVGYTRFVNGGIEEGHNERYYEVEDQRFLGQEGFRQKVVKANEVEGDRSIQRSLRQTVKELSDDSGIGPEILRSPDRGWKVSRVRIAIVYVLVRRLGFKLSEVATYMRRDVSTLSSLISRLSDRMQNDERTRREVDRLARSV